MLTEKYDVIILGAGIGGLGLAAILSSKEGKKVLVLEKEGEIGGRARSFSSNTIKTPKDFVHFLRTQDSWIIRTTPQLAIIFDKDLLKDYVFEAGAHGYYFVYGRVHYLLDFLGKPIAPSPNDCASWFTGGKFYQIERRGGFPWMNDEDFEETRKISRELVRTSVKEADKYNHVTFKSWIEGRTSNKAALDFHIANAALLTTINDPALMSAGEVIKHAREPVLGGYHMSHGANATIGYPGWNLVSMRLAEAIRQGGGRIETNTCVREVVVENGVARKVIAESDGKPIELEAPIIVSNLPITRTFQIIAEKHFPSDFVETVKSLWSADMLSMILGLKKPITRCPTYGFMEFQEEKAYIGIWPTSSWAPTRAPLGKQLIEAFTPVDKKIRNPEVAQKRADMMMNFMQTNYPDFEENLEWGIFVACDGLIPVAQAPGQIGDKRPGVKCPWIEGLYFVGDTVGSWGAGSGVAAIAALLCASKITGKDYLKILPEHLR